MKKYEEPAVDEQTLNIESVPHGLYGVGVGGDGLGCSNARHLMSSVVKARMIFASCVMYAT